MNAFHQLLHSDLFVDKSLFEFFFQQIDLRSIGCLPGFVNQNFVVKYRWLIKQIKNKNQYANKEDHKLHRDFDKAIENQSQPAFCERLATQVPCDLRLIRSKV